MDLVVKEYIKKIELSDTDGNYIVICNDNYYSVSKLFYSIIQEIKNNIHNKNQFIKDYGINLDDYDELLKLMSEKIGNIVSKEKISKSYINLPIKILSEKYVIFISEYLKIFFNKAIFRIFFPLVVIFSFFLYFFANNKYQEHTVFEVSLLDTFIVYLAILFIMIFHELGHSSASSFFEVKPKEIGFGFYILFPVLYSNVTRIWKLNKNKRVIVNLGGVYFQGIVNCFFLIYMLLNNQYNHFTYLLLLVVKTNLFVMAYSLFPFVRNDGYWIISDYFNIPNLNKKSYSCFIELLKRKKKINYALLLYSTGQYLFIFYLGYKYLPSIPRTINQFNISLKDRGFIDLVVNDFGILFKLIISLIIGLVMITTLLKFIKPIFIKNEKNSI